MKTVIIAGLDNLAFTVADLLDPKEYKLIGFGTPIKAAWNVYDEEGKILDDITDIPVMPIEAITGFDPELIVLAADNDDDDEKLKYALFSADYQGEVVSLREFYKGFSLKTAAIRKLAWRLDALGVEGAAADLGCYRGDISWQMNALMPERKLYLFDTFTGYDLRDIAKERELGLSDAKAGDYAMTPLELKTLDDRLLGRMPYEDQVSIVKGWFPETVFELEDTFALVHIDTGLYQPTYAGIQYFFPRMAKGGVILVSGYENGRSMSVRKAVDDLEAEYGAFLITPLCDIYGTVMITRP